MVGEDPLAFILEGEVVTMDVARPRAEAVGVREGQIVAVGASPEVRLRCQMRRSWPLGAPPCSRGSSTHHHGALCNNHDEKR